MLIYRLVSWIFIAAIGWVLFFFLFRTESQLDPDTAERGGIDADEPLARRAKAAEPKRPSPDSRADSG
jgi:hypothetical protein